MTKIEILTHAYNGALEMWGREFDRLMKYPYDEITACKERRYYKDVETIQAMILEEEQKTR